MEQTTASFFPDVGRTSASVAMPSISPLLGFKVTTIRDGLMVADARSLCTGFAQPWRHGHKSSDAMTDHGCSIRKPLTGLWRISSAVSLEHTSVRNIWRRGASWPVHGALSQAHALNRRKIAQVSDASFLTDCWM